MQMNPLQFRCVLLPLREGKFNMGLFKINSAIMFITEGFPVLHTYNKRLCHF